MEIREIASEETLKIRQNVMWPEKSIEFVKVAEDKEGIEYIVMEK